MFLPILALYMASEKEVMEKLSEVQDPELGLDIVSLGMIYKVGIEKAGDAEKVHITMTFTTPACPMIAFIVHQMEEKVRELPGAEPDIEIVFDPPWSPDRMSRKAKLRLGIE